MSERVERLRGLLPEPLLVTDVVNVRYLTGFASSNAAVLVEPDRVRVFADFRYAEQGRRLVGAEFVEVGRNLFAALAEALSGRIGFESEEVTFAEYETLRGGGLDLVPTRGVVRGLRDVKDPEELDAVRRAATISDRVFERLAGERFSGRTELELAWRIRELFHEEGADDLSFPTIVAAGENGANPHTDPGRHVVAEGELVTIDGGALVDGYHSDCTRTFAVGEPPARLRRAYDVVLEAQLAGLAAIAPGVAGRDVDAAARRIVDATEFAGMFGHGLGHGVGLDIHEGPTLRAESEDTLAVDNVVTVEPGIYVSGEGGIRIEDLVLVTEDGAERLTTFTKELVTVA